MSLEVQKGLDKYIQYWLLKNGNKGMDSLETKRQKLQRWKEVIMRKVGLELGKQTLELYPRGSSLERGRQGAEDVCIS